MAGLFSGQVPSELIQIALMIFLAPTLIVAAIVAVWVTFKKAPFLSLTNILFYLVLPLYIAVWLYFSTCHSADGACGVLLALPPILLKPAAFLAIILGMLVPAPAVVVGAPVGWLIAGLGRLALHR
ncbi:hypothetical protein [uncultured Cohaesibacter sp.]|uniref:hypothetical protein n=1 Tax=uncultured Cohaesibacter sp. TaxID=1002546 RepID=UPI0029C67A56|nr:hypothetical protein [uncultured Cohaesibacter sp.]